MVEKAGNDQRELISENMKKDGKVCQYKLKQYNNYGCMTLLQLWQKRRQILIWSTLAIFSLASIGISFSFKSRRIISDCEQVPSLKFYRSDSGTFSCTKQCNIGFGYPPQLIEDLVRDKEISFVFPVHAGDRGLLVNLLRSIRNLCVDCTEVPIIVITDDASKKAIHEILYNNNTSPYPEEPTIAASFPKLLIKLLRDVMPYYAVNQWNDDSLLVNGKHTIQSHKKMFGVLNGASTRFSWVMDVDCFFFKPMSLAKVLKTYLSSPYILTTHDWPVTDGIYECTQHLTQSFLSTGYTVEVMHWILDREIVSDFNNLVLKQYPTWNVPILFKKMYFFEHTLYHFMMTNQILNHKYMQYRVIEVRTLLGGNQSPLFQAILKTSGGGLIERISTSITNIPSIYHDVVHIWKELKIPVFRPEGSQQVSIDFALDKDVVIMTNSFKEELYRMSQSGYWKNPEVALKNAEKQGWKSLADHLKKRNNKTGVPS
jgi:hypothetical protein